MLVYRYRLYPTRQQEKALNDTTYICWKLYNTALAERKRVYEEELKTLTSYDQQRWLTQFKKSEPSEYWSQENLALLKAVNTQILKDVIARVDISYKNFFRGLKKKQKVGFPKFQQRRVYQSFTVPVADEVQGYKVIRTLGRFDRLYLSWLNIGHVHMRADRPMDGRIKRITIIHDCDEWYACFTCNIDKTQDAPPLTGKSIGLDLGLEKLTTTSDGEFIANARCLEGNLKKLARLQRQLARKCLVCDECGEHTPITEAMRKQGAAKVYVCSKCGTNMKRRSNRYIDHRNRIARLHKDIRNQRRDLNRKIAHRLCSDYDTIVVEDLKIRNMTQNHKLARAILDAGWGQLVLYIKQKAEQWGKTVEVVDPKDTSQLCSNCGEKVPKKLHVRVHKCPHCKTILDRDHNAAINVLSRATSL